MSKRKLMVFENVEFGEIRTIKNDGEPWFCGRDVAKALGYNNASDAIYKHVDDEDKMFIMLKRTDMQNGDVKRGKTKTVFVNESGLYALIFGSKLESAKRFKHWVTSEVLPNIRKHGAYMTDMTIDRLVENPDLIIELCNKLKSERQKNKELAEETAIQKQQIAEYEPKATYYDLVLQTTNAIPITVIAKDYGLTAQELNKILCNEKIQRKVSNVYVLNKKYSDKGYTKTKTFVKDDKSYIHMYWTQKGRLFIYDMLKQLDIYPLIERGNEDERVTEC